MNKLAGHVALITGAANGIGAETARGLAARGVRLILLDVAAEPLAAVARELDAFSMVADVRDLAAVRAAVDAGVARFGGIDLVLANAGIAAVGSILTIDPAEFERVLEVNLLGVFHTVRAALPSVIDRRGYILVVSSLAALVPGPGMAAYNASKAGVEHFANTLHAEVAARGVDVGCAHMTWIDTPLLQDAKSDNSAFRRMVAALPGPLSGTIRVSECADAFVSACERRSRRVYVPWWVGAVGWARMLPTTRLGAQILDRIAAEFLPQIDKDVATLGRSISARYDILDGS